MPRPAPAARLIVAAALLLAVGGCWSRRSPMVLVAYVPPPGMTATSVDAKFAGPIGRRLRSAPGVVGVSSISGNDEVDFYVTGAVDSGAGRLADVARAAVAATTGLPPGGRLVSVAFLNNERPIPAAEPGTVPAYAVAVDPARASAAGVTAADVESAIAPFTAADHPAIAERIAALRATRVMSARNADVTVGDVVTVSVERRPTSIRQDF